MDFLKNSLDFFLHLDEHLKQMIIQHGPWIYAILFAIVFAETGLVIMPFLPGDSLLFTAGVLSHPEIGGLNLWLVCAIFIVAALAGDNLNYFIGSQLGHRVFKSESSRFFKKSHLAKSHAFMEKHGPKAIILARFVPIVRTFMPFVAGMSDMTYLRFLRFSIIGALIWVGVCVGAGFLFGKIPAVQENFELVILAIVGLTIIPIAIEVARHKMSEKKASSHQES